jgi:hypothetical protein
MSELKLESARGGKQLYRNRSCSQVEYSIQNAAKRSLHQDKKIFASRQKDICTEP